MKKWIPALVFLGIFLFLALTWPYPIFILIGLGENSERDQKLTQEAIERGDYKICNRVAEGYMMSTVSPRRNCYIAVIKKNGDPKICVSNAIKGILGVRDCLEMLGGSANALPLCDQLDPTSWNSADCFSTVARAKNDPSICSKINDAYAFEKGNCYGSLVTKEDVSVCESIAEAYVRETCYTSYVNIGDIYPDFCDHFVVSQEYKNECYFAAAQKMKSSAICENIQGAGSATDYYRKMCVIRATREDLEQAQPSDAIDRWFPFHSAYFTLSFNIPAGFEVREDRNYVAIAQSPYYTREIGDDNAFMTINRYDQYNTHEGQIARYRKLLKNIKETQTIVDGTSFLTFMGDDWGRFEGESTGRVTVVFFESSSLEIIERPANSDQNFDPISLGEQILLTFRFSR